MRKTRKKGWTKLKVKNTIESEDVQENKVAASFMIDKKASSLAKRSELTEKRGGKAMKKNPVSQFSNKVIISTLDDEENKT